MLSARDMENDLNVFFTGQIYFSNSTIVMEQLHHFRYSRPEIENSTPLDAN